ncbi:hypothetical protein SPUCDC_4571 [Salmonella enterica subsp. enterica serovar Gallinarum/Pullorum str. CDC1983-67]|nr:hypothetical protein SPUL_4585 [Salmonella enterica subsp. enterica serovar Gallinarum/Pullorum str. RKS5078]AGU67286.1 hypothetical protein SPUCDC_4571 [Salmonella enterica subsp. enterica serovar Gallinarum/Pullorum str. CDC1983-67]
MFIASLSCTLYTLVKHGTYDSCHKMIANKIITFTMVNLTNSVVAHALIR